MPFTNSRRLGAVSLVFLLTSACSNGNNNNNAATDPDPVEAISACAEVIPAALQACITEVNAAAGACYFDGDTACAADDPGFTAALNGMSDQVGEACSDLPSLIALKPESYIRRTADQVDCLAATAHADTTGLELTCGPSYVEALPPRGEWTQIILPEEKWGSRCGDGTDYAIQIRPAPEGEPLDRVLIALQGGGVCIFENDCRSRLDSGLFNAQDDNIAGRESGITSNDPDNPFANWTKVYLPYCDQAVFTGVGVRTLGDIKIPEWQVTEYLPPYCFTGNCAIGPEIYRAFAPRLRQVPEQQILVLSNQKDQTQQGDAFFSDEAQWINAIRQAYCDSKDLNGIQWYLTSDSVNSVHVVSLRDEFYYGEVAGERMVDWFERAVSDPDSMSDLAEEGNFVTDIPGSLPFPCELP